MRNRVFAHGSRPSGTRRQGRRDIGRPRSAPAGGFSAERAERRVDGARLRWCSQQLSVRLRRQRRSSGDESDPCRATCSSGRRRPRGCSDEEHARREQAAPTPPPAPTTRAALSADDTPTRRRPRRCRARRQSHRLGFLERRERPSPPAPADAVVGRGEHSDQARRRRGGGGGPRGRWRGRRRRRGHDGVAARVARGSKAARGGRRGGPRAKTARQGERRRASAVKPWGASGVYERCTFPIGSARPRGRGRRAQRWRRTACQARRHARPPSRSAHQSPCGARGAGPGASSSSFARSQWRRLS